MAIPKTIREVYLRMSQQLAQIEEDERQDNKRAPLTAEQRIHGKDRRLDCYNRAFLDVLRILANREADAAEEAARRAEVRLRHRADTKS
jgi:hypothetical protein